MISKRALLIGFAAASLFAGGAPAFAQTGATAPQQGTGIEEPAAFSADEMTHDKQRSLITARGHVEVNQGERTLFADAISYDQANDVIRASGNVTLHRPSGDVLFAESMEVSGDLKNGIIENFHAIMADRSRFAAQTATLENDETMTLERAVYSPCQQCKDDPSRPLLWQIKAVRVVHDRVNKVVEYENAWLEFAGVPVLYSPYLTHPDPTVKRKSGLLPMRMGGSSDLGMVARVPYYYVIDEYSDMTLTPILASEEYGGVAGEYRERFTKGEISANGSLAYDSQSDTFGHLAAKARFDINDDWRWGTEVNRASSDTYMRRYGFGNDTTLTSQAYVEGFRGNNYTSVSTMAFQGLRATDVASNIPIVLPLAQFDHQGEANRYGAYNTFNANMAMLTRTEGTDTKRVSLKPSWNLPYIAPKGDIYKLSASLGVDFFNSTDLIVPANRGGIKSGSALRVTPELAFDWRWPFARRSGTITQMVEPIGQFIVSPYGGNSYKMANEDSLDIDFNDTNLFSTNRHTGYDRVESGPRANYGLKWGIYGDQGGSTSVMMGQSYRIANDDAFQTGSGLENNFSDYVARVQISPGPYLDLLYRTRLDKDTLNFQRNEASVSGKAGWFNYNADYVFFDRQQDSEFNGRKEVNFSLGAQLTDTWSSRLSGVRDLAQDGGQRSMKMGFTYDDECFSFDTTLSRTFYRDREIRPTDAIMFRLVFKTLGEVTSDVTTN